MIIIIGWDRITLFNFYSKFPQYDTKDIDYHDSFGENRHLSMKFIFIYLLYKW